MVLESITNSSFRYLPNAWVARTLNWLAVIMCRGWNYAAQDQWVAGGGEPSSFGPWKRIPVNKLAWLICQKIGVTVPGHWMVVSFLRYSLDDATNSVGIYTISQQELRISTSLWSYFHRRWTHCVPPVEL